jgi:hypothetical protein
MDWPPDRKLTQYPQPKPEKYLAPITSRVYDSAEFLTGGKSLRSVQLANPDISEADRVIVIL